MAKTKKKSKKQRAPKLKKKLTAEQKAKRKADKAERQKRYEWIFINGKQVRIKRQQTFEEFLEQEDMLINADPVWLHQNELWYIQPVEESGLWGNEMPEGDQYAELLNDFWGNTEPEWLPGDKPDDEPSARFTELDDPEVPF